MMDQHNGKSTEERIRCKGRCFQSVAGGEKRCHAYGHHEWCENYMVRLSLGSPEFFEEEPNAEGNR